MLALILFHFAGAEIHGRILAFPNFRGDDIKDAHNTLFEIMPLVIPVHGQEQRLALAHLHEFTKHRVVFREYAVEDVIDFITGVQIGGIICSPRTQLPRADGELVGAQVQIIQIAEMGPLRGINEVTDQVPFDVGRALFIGRKRVVPKNFNVVCHGIILSVK